eukprot:CAMPEP_0172735302 /NCGR_PEP_ID=MMETSP1074-20121228/112189_1 /TAXON_ID=2916 /ORGANISM="Ceratium fusus, Strain PA161109" /LENGTH=96 /DNA_ID=CAMNT_0013564271 /DNA_START=40 /DNA_END=330 /DNA_ORIENTATION=-
MGIAIAWSLQNALGKPLKGTTWPQEHGSEVVLFEISGFPVTPGGTTKIEGYNFRIVVHHQVLLPNQAVGKISVTAMSQLKGQEVLFPVLCTTNLNA